MRLIFINANGLTFTATVQELREQGTGPLEYIKYCLDRGSILVGVEPIE